jgi:dimethylhistidine N-methyltransferase
LRADFPELAVHPVTADFTQAFELPAEVRDMPKVGFFPGSTLGNFEPEEAARFLRRAADILGPGALMILGVDLEKDEAMLHPAYNDAAGVTARFNLNLLVRMNRELGANFDVSAFRHCAIYNHEQHRIEMHLVSRKAQKVRLCGRTLAFAAGESIHTENSYKYSIPRFAALAGASGWRLQKSWTDAKDMFSVHALRAES